MPNRLEDLPVEVIQQVLSYVDYGDAVTLHQDSKFRSYRPDLMDRKGRDGYRGITIVAKDKVPNPKAEAEHRCPFEALVYLNRHRQVAQYVKSLDLRPRGGEGGWWNHAEAKSDPPLTPDCSALAQEPNQKVRLWAFRRFIAPKLRRWNFWQLHYEAIFREFNYWRRDPDNLFLLTAVLPNVESLSLDPSCLEFYRIPSFWSSLESFSLGHIRGNRIPKLFERLTTLKLFLDPKLGCWDLNTVSNLFPLLHHFPKLYQLHFEGLLTDFTGDVLGIDPSQESVKRLDFYDCDISYYHIADVLDHFPNVRTVVLERRHRVLSLADINEDIMDRSKYTEAGRTVTPAAEEAFVALLTVDGNSYTRNLERLRVGFEKAAHHESFPDNTPGFRFLPSLRVLDASANVFDPTCQPTMSFCESLPETVEKLKLQNIPDMRLATRLLEGIGEAKAEVLPNLRRLVFSSPKKEVVDYVRTVCEEADIAVKVIGDTEEWVFF